MSAGPPAPRAAPHLAPSEGRGTGQALAQVAHPSPSVSFGQNSSRVTALHEARFPGEEVFPSLILPPQFTEGSPRTAMALGRGNRDLSQGTFILSPRGPDTQRHACPLPSVSFFHARRWDTLWDWGLPLFCMTELKTNPTKKNIIYIKASTVIEKPFPLSFSSRATERKEREGWTY